MRPFTIAGLQLPLRPGDNVELIAAEVLRVKRLYPFPIRTWTGLRPASDPGTPRIRRAD